VLSLGTAEHVGSHFRLSQRFGAPGAVQDANVVEGRVRSDVGLILRTAELPDRVLEIYGPTGRVLPPKDRWPGDGEHTPAWCVQASRRALMRNEYVTYAHTYA
jgi:hypothetical protein